MKLTVVGSSPAWPNPAGAHSGYRVEGLTGEGRSSLLLDCGPGVLGRIARQADGRPSVDAIVISHFHLDHWGDLVPWVWNSVAHPARDGDAGRVPLWVPPGGREQLERLGALLAYPRLFEPAFTVEEYEPGREFMAAGFSIVTAQVVHYGLEAHAIRVSDGKQALVYSGDTAPCDALSELAQDADLLLCEATLRSGELDGELRGHLSLDEAESLFAGSGARRLLITHRPVDLPTPERFELAYDGMVVDL